MIKITNIKIRADLSDDELFEKIYKKYKINKNDVTEIRIIKNQLMHEIKLIYFIIIR